MAGNLPTITRTDLNSYFGDAVARGKVRDLYQVDDSTLLFVATDRISAFDFILKTGIPGKGALLTLLSAHWFSILTSMIPSLRTHFLTLDLPVKLRDSCDASAYRSRAMQVRRFKAGEVLPIESIVRGYITGSAWSEYKRSGTVNGMPMPVGLRESEKLALPIWTPSTKAPAGQHDENISSEQAVAILEPEFGPEFARRVEELSIDIYIKAHDYAAQRGIIIADTKFEFARDSIDGSIVLIDEVLTPDSSRFWPAAGYVVGQPQESLDKQFLRDFLISTGQKGKADVEIPLDIVAKTADKYIEAFERLTGKYWDRAVQENGYQDGTG